MMHRKGGVLTPGRFVARLFCIPKLHRAAARSPVHLTTPPESFFLPLRRKRGYPPPPPLRPVVVDLSLPLLASQPQLVTRIVCTSLLLPPSLLCDRFFSAPSAASQMTDTWLRGRAADGWPFGRVGEKVCFRRREPVSPSRATQCERSSHRSSPPLFSSVKALSVVKDDKLITLVHITISMP